jgi:hypothetical protein
MTKLIVAFRSLAKGPKSYSFWSLGVFECLYDSKKSRLFLYTLLIYCTYIVVTECVYCTVRAEFLNSITVLVFFFKCHGSSNYSPACYHARPSSILVKSIWVLWWSERYWDRFLPEDANFPLWTSIHRQTILIFIYMLVSRKNRGTKPWSLPKYNSLSEIMGRDTREKSASTFCSFKNDILLTSCVKIVTDIVFGWKMTTWVPVWKHDKLRKVVPYCSTLSYKQERYCRKQNRDFLCLLKVFQKKKMRTWLL